MHIQCNLFCSKFHNALSYEKTKFSIGTSIHDENLIKSIIHKGFDVPTFPVNRSKFNFLLECFQFSRRPKSFQQLLLNLKTEHMFLISKILYTKVRNSYIKIKLKSYFNSYFFIVKFLPQKFILAK